MRMLWCGPLLLAAGLWADEAADRAAIKEAIVTFNHPRERATVLAQDADLSSLARYREWEMSQVYFHTDGIRFVTSDVALVDATGSQYGSLVLKRAIPSLFVMRREGADWKVVVLRMAPAAAGAVPWWMVFW